MLAFKRELRVNFVTDHQEIFLHCKLSNALKLRALRHTSGWIGRKIQHQHLAARLPSRFNGIGIDPELVFGRGGDRDWLRMREHDAWAIRNIAGLVVQHLIAWIEYRAQSNVQGL